MAAANHSLKMCFTESTCRMIPLSDSYDRHLLDLEKNFDECAALTWLAEHWKINFVVIVAYLLAIYGGRCYMRNRTPLRLQTALLGWNGALAIFSIFSAWRTVPALLYQLGQIGFHETVCGVGHRQFHQSVGMYMWWFALSKFLELGDTGFIVLRKSPLLFLHWFHHATVCFFVWSCSAYLSYIHVYFMAMNYFVHSFMYSYYALKVLRIRVPKPVNMAITSLQLLQMMGGVFVTLYVAYWKATPEVGCCVQEEAITIAVSIYLAYFVLFAHFFVRAYVFNKPLQKKIQ